MLSFSIVHLLYPLPGREQIMLVLFEGFVYLNPYGVVNGRPQVLTSAHIFGRSWTPIFISLAPWNWFQKKFTLLFICFLFSFIASAMPRLRTRKCLHRKTGTKCELTSLYLLSLWDLGPSKSGCFSRPKLQFAIPAPWDCLCLCLATQPLSLVQELRKCLRRRKPACRIFGSLQ